jgi:phosphatidylserine decarboxylase
MAVIKSIRDQLAPIHPEGYPFIGGFALATLILWWLFPPLGWIAFMATLWCAYFFRDPARVTPIRRDLVVAPADGRVCFVGPAAPPPDLGLGAAPLTKLSIFMNVFDCHVNRYPTDGTVAYRHYNPGAFGHAAAEKSSLSNEQASVGLTTPRGKVLVRQIAGLVARRIVTDDEVGTAVHQGERMGMIRFGSRVDLFLPLDTRVLVHVGDTTRVGVTVVAEWS